VYNGRAGMLILYLSRRLVLA